MKFQFNPQRSDATLAISVSGETAIINGIEYDLSPLTEGQSISFGVGSAKRDGGITVSLPLPYPQNPSIDPMQVYEVEAADGPVAVPGHDSEQPAEIVAGVIDWPIAPSIEFRRAAVWEQIKAKRESLKSGGVKVGAHWFHSDADSRIQQLGLVIMGANMPAGLKWKTIDNGLVDMTPTLAQQIFATTANWDATVFGVAETHRAAVMASENPEAYDWSAGWPAGYTGQVNE